MSFRPAALASIAATALGIGTWLVLGGRPPALPEIGGYVLAAPRALPAVELVDERGELFRSVDFAGRWSFLYFGYTYCPDVCPLTLVELANLKEQLSPELQARAAYYLVSVDPKRDTPGRLREYVAYFDAEFRGLTGTEDALAALAQASDTVFDLPEGQDGDNYLVSHSSNIVLLDPSGRVHAILAPPHAPATLAADFTKVVARYDGAK